LEIKVYQGERSMAADNKMLGVSNWWASLRPARHPASGSAVDIDANGILNVTAKDRPPTTSRRSPYFFFGA